MDPEASSIDSAQKERSKELMTEEFLSLVGLLKRYKDRSYTTMMMVHVAQIWDTEPPLSAMDDSSSINSRVSRSVPPSIAANPDDAKFSLDVIFIGDSMIERIKTTGRDTPLNKLPRSLNLGVGGDKIENVLYRLHEGYIHLLIDKPTKLWVVQIGTNNLKKRAWLQDKELANYKVLLECLVRLSPESRVLVTGIFNRHDIDSDIVLRSNNEIKKMIDGLNEMELFQMDGTRKLFLAGPPDAITLEELEDHVHLNEEGYETWSRYLEPLIEVLLERPGILGGAG